MMTIDELLAGATVADHVRGSYEVRLKLHGWLNREDKAQHFRDALVSVAGYIGRPLTAEEVLESSRDTVPEEGKR
jgi:hypothetical protein